MIGPDWLIPFSAGMVLGLVLGLFHFGGLWWTSRRIVSATGGPLLPALSLFGRLAVLAVALGVMAGVHPFLLVGSLPGLVAARALWIRSVTWAPSSPSVGTPGHGSQGDGHG